MRRLAVIAVLLGMGACATEAGLQGKTWTWERTIYNNDTEHTPNEAGAFTLTFLEDGQVQVTTDCNNMRGSYTIDEHRLTFGQLAATRM